MVSVARRQNALKMWATLIYWTGKVSGVLVAETVTEQGRPEFVATAESAGRWRWIGTRAWNLACMAAVAYRIGVETWPITVEAAHRPQASCYDTVCGGVWCVYACVYYAVAWLDRASEVAALAAALTWRRRSTVDCLNSAAAMATECWSDERTGTPSAADVPWHVYLTVVFPVVHFATAANAISPTRKGVGRAIVAAVATVASCAPVAAHGTAAALLAVANNSMRSINHQIIRLSLMRHRSHRHRGDERDRDGDDDDDRRQRATVALLARRHWLTAELVTDGVCHAYGMDLMVAVLLAAVRVTYVAISVFHRLTNDQEDSRTNMSLAVIMQLTAWFGQFAYLAYVCDELTSQSSEIFDNLNSFLLDILKESHLSVKTYSSKMQEIEAVQEFTRQVVARQVIVHSCGGLIALNLSLITTILGITLTYFIVLLQFESSYGSGTNNTITAD